MKRICLMILTLPFFFFSCKKSNDSGNNILVITPDTNHLVTLVESDYRPLYHFTPARNWMNDPNGLVFYKGAYHLFYQYNPNGNVWGPMNWGHATSTDLFNWQDLSVALSPDNLGTIFSGCAVIDSNNTSGFKNGSEYPMVAIYTNDGSKQVQSVAYSNDAGNSFSKYTSNPVVPNTSLNDFRDPKVFWYAQLHEWVMVLAAGDRIKIYTSTDLKAWTFKSDFGVGIGAHGGVWECPDLFQLPVTGTNISKWVLLVSLNAGPNGGSATQYFVGDFDGVNFTNTSSATSWIDYGTDNYAGSTYNNIPTSDGRRIFIGWMSNWNYAGVVPTTTWRSTMTTPRMLSLANISSNYILQSTPVVEIGNYKNSSLGTSISGSVNAVSLKNDTTIKTGSYEIDFTADLSASNTMSLSLGNAKESLVLSYDKVGGNMIIDRSSSGNVAFNNMMLQKVYCPYIPVAGQKTNFQILVDKTSIEVFIDNGTRVMTSIFFPKYQYNLLNLQGDANVLTFSNFKTMAISKSLKR